MPRNSAKPMSMPRPGRTLNARPEPVRTSATWTPGEHRDVTRSIIEGHRSRERQHATFARSVRRYSRLRLQTLDASGVDDCATAALANLWQCELAHQKTTLQIDIQDAVPLLLGRVFRALIGVERLYANVIDEHVDAAEMVDCLLDHALTFARF